MSTFETPNTVFAQLVATYKTPEPTPEQKVETATKELIDGMNACTTKSAKIRYLYAAGVTKYNISKILGIRYQHVRNILITPVKNPRA